MICFDNYRLTIGLLGAMLIIGAVLMSEHAVDKNRGLGGGLVGVLFLAGWATIAYVAALDSNNKFSRDRFVRISIPALAVLAFAAGAQYKLQDGLPRAMVFAVLFMVSWMVFAWQIATDGKFLPKYLNKQKAYLALGGAVGVGASMGVLFMNRDYNIFSNDRSGPGNVYNPGLALFSASWIAIVGAMALQ